MAGMKSSKMSRVLITHGMGQMGGGLINYLIN